MEEAEATTVDTEDFKKLMKDCFPVESEVIRRKLEEERKELMLQAKLLGEPNNGGTGI